MTALEPVLPSVTEPPADGSDDSLEAQVDALATSLEATAELPIDRETNRWLGEAEAVARDAAAGSLEPETIRTRVRQVQRLLSEAGEPEHEEAADYLEAARERCRDLLGE